MDLSKLLLSSGALLFSLGAAAPLGAATDARSALIEAAKKETRLMIYSSVSATDRIWLIKSASGSG